MTEEVDISNIIATLYKKLRTEDEKESFTIVLRSFFNYILTENFESRRVGSAHQISQKFSISQTPRRYAIVSEKRRPKTCVTGNYDFILQKLSTQILFKADYFH